MGRPTKYDEKRPGQARFICERWGADDVDLAAALGIAVSTLYDWKREHPEFSEAVEAGKLAYDDRIVRASILKTAEGYHYTEEILGRKGVIVEIKRYARPDPRAQALWMLNRHGWRTPGGGQGQLPPASGPSGGDDGARSEPDPRDEQLAREILEARHGTRIRHVESRAVDPDATKKNAVKKGMEENESESESDHGDESRRKADEDGDEGESSRTGPHQ